MKTEAEVPAEGGKAESERQNGILHPQQDLYMKGVLETKNAGTNEPDCRGCKGNPACNGLCTKRISVFQGLSDEAHLSLVRLAQHRDFRRGDTVFLSEDRADSILILRYGRIKLSRILKDGQELVLGILSGGDVTGEQTIYSGENMDMDATALEDCGICLISAQAIAGLVMRRPDVGVRLLHSIGRKLHDAQHLVEILSRRRALARLSGFLLLHAERAGNGAIELSHEEIAASLSLSRETVTRKLAEMSRAGMVSSSGYRQIRVLDRSALQAAFMADE